MSVSATRVVENAVLESVERRGALARDVIVQHANRARAASGGVKVGGHQASSASIVSIMTALYFE